MEETWKAGAGQPPLLYGNGCASTGYRYRIPRLDSWRYRCLATAQLQKAHPDSCQLD